MNAECVTTTEERKEAAVPLRGLTQAEARERLRKFGPNDPTRRQRGALALELVFLFLNPLVVILLLASVVSAVLGQTVDAAIVFLIFIVLVGILLPFTPLALVLGFTALPLPFFLFLAASTMTYLILVELAKRLFFSRAMAPRPKNERAAV